MKHSKHRIICVILCIAAIITLFLPIVRVEVSFFGRSTSTTFSMSSFFNRPDNPFSTFDLPNTQQNTIRDLFDLSGEDNPFANVSRRLVSCVVAYFGAIILLLVVLVLTFIAKLKKARIILLVLAIMLFIYAGYGISTITVPLQEGFSNLLGFFALFIDFMQIVTITLRYGYWLALIAMGCLLVVNVAELRDNG